MTGREWIVGAKDSRLGCQAWGEGHAVKSHVVRQFCAYE